MLRCRGEHLHPSLGDGAVSEGRKATRGQCSHRGSHWKLAERARCACGSYRKDAGAMGVYLNQERNSGWKAAGAKILDRLEAIESKDSSDCTEGF